MLQHKKVSLADISLSSRRIASYALGPVDPATVAWLAVQPDDAPAFSLLVPGPDDLPVGLLADDQFRAGAIAGYSVIDLSEELEHICMVGLPSSLVNWVHRAFAWDVAHGGNYAWIVGYVLGALSYLAETDLLLALVGVAHLSFLLFLIPAVPVSRLYGVLHDAMACHDLAVRDYRAKLRALRDQGYDLHEASRMALAGVQGASEQGMATLHARRSTLTIGRSTLTIGRSTLREEEVA